MNDKIPATQNTSPNITSEQLQKLLDQADIKLSHEARIEAALIRLEKLETEVKTANHVLVNEKILSTYYVDNYIAWTSMILFGIVAFLSFFGKAIVKKYLEDRVDERIDARVDKKIEPLQEQTNRVNEEQKRAADRHEKDYELSLELSATEDIGEKISIITEAITHEESNKQIHKDYLSTLYSRRGHDHDSQGRYDLSIQDYDKAILLNPEHANSYFCRAIAILLTTGNQDAAIKDIAQAINYNESLRDEARNQEEFEGLHNNSEFRKLVGLD